MDAAGVSLASVDLCIRYGKELKTLCAAFRNADEEISERVLRVENGWLRWSQQLNFARNVQHLMDENHLEIYEQTLQVFLSKLQAVTAALRHLIEERKSQTKPRSIVGSYDDNLDVGGSILNSAAAPSYAPRRAKYAMKKKNLDKAIEELEIWQRTADPSWFLLMKIASPKLDVAIAENYPTVVDGSSSMPSIAATIPSVVAMRPSLRAARDATSPPAGITFGPEELARLTIRPIPYCDARIAWQPERSGSNGSSRQPRSYVLNTIMCPYDSKYRVVKEDTRDLARRLQHDEPQTFGLLSCKGFVVEQRPSASDGDGRGGGGNPHADADSEVAFTMIFRAPWRRGGTPPRSLRDLLLGPPPPSLSVRFEIARELAKSVSYVHSFGFVHKNIRPEAFLRFAEETAGEIRGEMHESTTTVAAAPAGGTGTITAAPETCYCLVGFENFRREQGWTQKRGDNTPTRNIYRHPSRQGLSLREDYVMQHDIYSLGVCLLEVGRWRSFVDYHQVATGSECPLVPALSLAALGLPGDVVGGQGEAGVAGYLETAGKNRLLQMAREQLPGCMGSKYAEIVETCLTCLDPENVDFGDAREFEDEDGIRVGVRYIEKVLLRLNVLNV